MDDVQGVLVRSVLFRNVPTSLVSEVAMSSEARLLGARERLLSHGEPHDKLHVVISGALTERAGADQSTWSHLGPGDCVGEHSLLGDRAARADVVADESTVVLSMEREQLWSLVEASPDLARNLLRILGGRASGREVVPGQSVRLRRYFERIAMVDPLTGLHNRRWLDDAFPRQMERAQRSAQPAALLMIDIDRFKRINDLFGHLTGDAVLGRVAQVLMTGVRPHDLLARYGGEEFVVMLPAVDRETLLAVAERLRRAVEVTVRDNDSQDVPPTTVSIGAARMQAGDRLEDLVNRAGVALSKAKALGRNQTVSAD